MAVNDADYQRQHKLVRRIRGLANEHDCHCGKRACDWAWVRDSDPEDPNNYVPMCRSCHKKYDLPDSVKQKQQQERERVSKTAAFKGWSPERREAQRLRMLKKWSDPKERAKQAKRASRDKPWLGQSGGAR